MGNTNAGFDIGPLVGLDQIGLPGGGGGFMGWNEFDSPTFVSITTAAGTYTYTADQWADLMSNGPEGGNSIGFDGTIYDSSGNVAGMVSVFSITPGVSNITASLLPLVGSTQTKTPTSCNPAVSHCSHPKPITCTSAACHKEPFTPMPWTHEDTCGLIWAVGGPPLAITPAFEVAPVLAWTGYGISAVSWVAGAICL